MSSTTTECADIESVNAELIQRLSEKYGTMLGSSALIKELAYPSPAAFQQALVRGAVPVPVFKVQQRRGSFALTRDVALWLSTQRAMAINSKSSSNG